ncbi:hypothetical protein DIPPA_35933 [Diplonema papillatum]|nr:hypothetical protein DIPPA_35933 [Diplonema papillatum]
MLINRVANASLCVARSRLVRRDSYWSIDRDDENPREGDELEVCGDLIAEYTQLPDKLRLAYTDACSIHFEDCAGPFGVDAASKEQLAEWKRRTCPPHATPSNVLGV